MSLEKKFNFLNTKNAPGQEHRQSFKDLSEIMVGKKLNGKLVDFSHGDVDAFEPIPESKKIWEQGYSKGGGQAYTEYRGDLDIRKKVASRLSDFTNQIIDPERELIITPGTQGALFLAMGATISNETKVAIVEPDYFANRKLVKFFGGQIHPVKLNYQDGDVKNYLDYGFIERIFISGVKVFVLSNPNNPTGIIYSKACINKIGELAKKYDVTLIIDQLYSRMLYSNEEYTHLCSCDVKPKNMITIMGPSKTESLSGFRLGVAFGSPKLIERMESLQAIVSLRASGYNQAVLNTWFDEPAGWISNRITEHEEIRNDLLKIFRNGGLETTCPQGGSYLYPKLPPLSVGLENFVRLLRVQANVIVTPSIEFDRHCQNRIRLNFSQDKKEAVAAAQRIVDMTKIYAIDN